MYKKVSLLLFIFILNSSSYEEKDKPISYIFSHGLVDSHKQAFNYLESSQISKPYIIKYPLVTFDYPDVSQGIFKINRFQTSLAQDNEIDRLAQVYFSCMQDKSTILVGVSRGASTIINFIAIHNPKNAVAAILESPFDCVENIVQSMIHRCKIQWLPGISKKGHSLMGFLFCKYDPNGPRPIDMIEKLPIDLPILIVCSANDALVPVWSSLNLYQALYNQGHQNVYLLVLLSGRHANLISDPGVGPIYQQVTHAFYKRCNLSHDPLLATQGEPLLKHCQPHPSNLNHFYPAHSYYSPSFNTSLNGPHKEADILTITP